MVTHSDQNAAALLPIWDRPSALDRLGGDEDLLQELLGMLLAQMAEMIPKLAQAIQQGDADSLERTAHSLKGAAASLSAERFRQTANELEMMGHARDLSQAQRALNRLEQEARLLRETLEA
jgi:HPt (histidine-containing phosphotransfer) domain-containing protein